MRRSGSPSTCVTDADCCFPVDDLVPKVAVSGEPLARVVQGLDVLVLQPGADVLVAGAGRPGSQMLARSGATP